MLRSKLTIPGKFGIFSQDFRRCHYNKKNYNGIIISMNYTIIIKIKKLTSFQVSSGRCWPISLLIFIGTSTKIRVNDSINKHIHTIHSGITWINYITHPNWVSKILTPVSKPNNQKERLSFYIEKDYHAVLISNQRISEINMQFYLSQKIVLVRNTWLVTAKKMNMPQL